jgi:hypothetical protein
VVIELSAVAVQVGDGLLEAVHRVLRIAQKQIAVVAQESPDTPTDMIVVHMHPFRGVRQFAAEAAAVFLSGSHRLVPADVRRFIHTSASEIARSVERHFGRLLEPVTITLTDGDGFVELQCAAEQALASEMTASRKVQHARGTQRQVRRQQPSGWTGVNAAGGTLVLLCAEARELHSIQSTAVVLAHELVHCEQIGRPGIRSQKIANARHDLGVEPLDKRAVKAWNRLLAQHEREAYRLEKPLAKQVLRKVAV